MTVDGNVYSLEFSFDDFAEIQLKFAPHSDRNLVSENASYMFTYQ